MDDEKSKTVQSALGHSAEWMSGVAETYRSVESDVNEVLPGKLYPLNKISGFKEG